MLRGYDALHEVSRSPWFVLLRGVRRHDGVPVLIKRAVETPSSADAEAVEREFDVVRHAQVRGVPRALELLRDGHQRAIVVADPGGRPWVGTVAAGPLPLGRALAMVGDLCGTLAALHDRDVIVGGLSPWGLLVDAADHVTVVDFLHAGTAALPPAPLSLASSARYLLPYASPERTGRMNRAVDHRTDLYSVGVLLYELVTGAPPFVSDDPFELVHWHVARPPVMPTGLDPRVADALTAILSKLLAKGAEERYQSAAGARADVRTCLEALQGSRALRSFLPGTRDISARFLLSEKLYGRAAELSELSATLDVARAGGRSLVLIGGASGVGKTALIQALSQPLVRARGHFASGKFDQVARSMPLGGVIHAFGGLMRQLLSESPERLARWRSRLGEALGSRAAVLAEVVPEVTWLLGPQPAPPALDGPEALNRFQMTFVSFVGALASAEHPLVLFLDDLQWADPASLSLLPPLLTSEEIAHLLVVGAYRDSEVDASHPLRAVLGQLDHDGVRVSRVTLAPLRREDVTDLLVESLRLPGEEVTPLAGLVHQATGGSPLFVNQFLRTLHRDRLLWFDGDDSRWRFDLGAVAAAVTTDDVVTLMTQRIQRLSAAEQTAVRVAALLGGSFTAAVVAVVTETTLGEATAALRGAVSEGLLVPSDGAYRFLHDRVQQAAIELIPPGERVTVHAHIGWRLLRHWDRHAEPERVFEVVGHLNHTVDGIPDEGQRVDIARLNLEAGRRAKGATAWEAAAGYFDLGTRALGASRERHVDVAFPLQLDAAECHFLARNFTAAEEGVARCVDLARSAIDRAEVLALRMVIHENRSQYDQAVASGREALRVLGVSLGEEASAAAALEQEIAAIDERRAERPIASLVDLPAMSDAPTQLAMRILASLWSSAYIRGHQVVARLISATLVRLSLDRGLTEDSAYGFVTHAITIGPDRGDYAAAYEWGALALAVNARFDDRKRRAKIHQQFHAHVCLWRRPFSECVVHAREATRSGLEGGDLIYAGYGAVTASWAAWPIANDLDAFVREHQPATVLVERLHLDDFRDALGVMLAWAMALQGRTTGPLSLQHARFDEQAYLARFGGEVFFRTFYYTAKLQLAVLHEDVESAVRARQELDAGTLPGTIWPVLADFWGGLAWAAAFPTAPPELQQQYWARMTRARESLGVLTDNAPENYRVFWLLLSAEMARLSLRLSEAARLAAEAVAYAARIGNVSSQAIAHEIAARAARQQGDARGATDALERARRFYLTWGAMAKVEQLRTTYHVGAEHGDAAPPVADLDADATASFDLSTVLKISRAMAVEVRLSDLLPKLMHIAIEGAGAQRGLFVQESHGRWLIEAQGVVDSNHVRALEGIPVDDGALLAPAIVQLVQETGRGVVVADAIVDERFAGDPYVRRERPRSILAVPVVHHGRVSGLLYLEHRAAAGVFTSERVSLMRLVSAQAAIALENARLYRDVSDEAAHRRRAEEVLREVTQGTATSVGEGFFRSLVQHLATALRVRYAFVTECRDERTKVRSLAFWKDGQSADNFEYDVADTPCKHVLEGGVCHYPSNVQRAFPRDLDLVALKAESYLGAPMVDAGGHVIGHIAVLDDRPMEDESRASAVLSIFSARAGAELERLNAEYALRAAMAEVEALKNRLQAENVYLQDEIRGEHNFEELVGRSSALTDVLKRVERVADTDATVLILGETGTGKELIARALHSRSSRRHRPLVKVNCGAISAGLVESELFGHVKGAFTGAIDKRVGRFELADGGTIFLDEVGELPADVQVKLLRVLQEREFEPVGSSRTVRVNVRVIAATNRDLERAVAEGRFRSDLYFRLNVVSLTLPPLRDRKGDVPLLVAFFVAKFAKQFGKPIQGVTQDTLRWLTAYGWPGNIRELQNVIERAVVLCETPVLSLGRDLLPADAPNARAVQFGGAEPAPVLEEPSHSRSLEDTERRHIIAVLEQVKYVIEGPAGAARVLDLHPNTLRSRMKKLGIARPVRAAHD